MSETFLPLKFSGWINARHVSRVIETADGLVAKDETGRDYATLRLCARAGTAARGGFPVRIDPPNSSLIPIT
jgi:hypothetical protein